MTILSRLRLETRDLRVVNDLADVELLHRRLMRAFPQTDGPSPRRELAVLFRTELSGAVPSVIVQSGASPDWTLLGHGYLRAAETKDISDALDAIRDGRVLRFLLVANPSRKTVALRPNEAPRRNNRRLALVTDEERHRWLANRGLRDGFELAGAGPHDGVRIDPLPADGRRSRVVVRSVRFEGRLRVVDADRLRAAVRAGIGPAKAYGCGLLSLAPDRS